MNNLSNPFIDSTGRQPTCLQMLQLILDGEATPEQKSFFNSHMDECMPCYKSYHLDMAIKELIKSKCCGSQVPEDLVERIKSKVNFVS